MSQRSGRNQFYDVLVRGVVRRTKALRSLVVVVVVVVGSVVVACAGPMRGAATGVNAPISLPFVTDTLRSTQVAAGVVYHFIHSPAGPWAIHVLEVDRSACWDIRAVKAHHSAVGREATSALLRSVDEREPVIAGVNADFFSFVPPGVPRGAHVENGQLIVGPGERPVLGVDSAGAVFIGTLHAAGSATIHGIAYPLGAWNRIVPRRLAILDRSWGAQSDSGAGRIEVALAGSPPRVAAIDTLPSAAGIPSGGVLLVADRDSDTEMRHALLALRVGDTVLIDRRLTKAHLRNVVGGWPIVLRDSVVTRAADSAGASFAPVRHPRTGVGLASNGRELIVVVVDGRQKPYSDGMTLRELAELFRSLGARDAINLDGGGSSTFVLADSVGAPLTVRNRPSDKTERAVANALGVQGCRGVDIK